MKTILESVSPDRRAELEHEVRTAQQDLEFWQRESEHAEIELIGVLTIDPLVKWNLDFHRRRVRALERAQRELLSAEARAS